ncbi:hypothetical protein H5410_037453, partial [Solanum commersonii]
MKVGRTWQVDDEDLGLIAQYQIPFGHRSLATISPSYCLTFHGASPRSVVIITTMGGALGVDLGNDQGPPSGEATASGTTARGAP